MSTNLNPPAIPIPANIVSLTAPRLFGQISSAYLFGVLSVQVYIYHLNFPQDANYIKAFVYTVFLLEFASSIMSLYDMYHWFARGFGNMLVLGDVQLCVVDTPMIGAIVAAAVQMFYCYRIYTINKKAWWVSVIVALLALAEVVSGLYGAIVAERVRARLLAESKAMVAVYVFYISSVVADILIAMTMITLLLLSRISKGVQSASQSSTSQIKKIVNLIVETNLASAITALLTLILLVTVPTANYFTCPSYILAKIYSNSQLLILNNRYYLAIGSGAESSSGLFKTSRSHNKLTSDFPSSEIHFRDPAQFEVDTTTESFQGSFNHRNFEV